MIYITRSLAIDESEIREEFIHASGPGGQNVNKVATAVQLRFDAARSSPLPDEVRERLKRFRTQGANRQDALDRFIALLRRAAEKPKVRHETKPSRASRRRRMESKHRRSETKRLRRAVRNTDAV